MGFFDFFRKKSEDNVADSPAKPSEARKDGQIVLARVSFPDGYVSPSGGFSNGAYYEVCGKNPKTGRVNRKKVIARSESEAIEKAWNEYGFTEASASCIPFAAPTEKQLDFAKRLHLFIPEGADENDVACMLHRVADAVPGVDDPDFSPISGCSQEFANYLVENNTVFSAYIDAGGAFEVAVRSFPPREKCKLYAYCVWCHLKKEPVSVPIRHPQEWLFDQFADEYCENSEFLEALVRASFLFMHGNEKTVKTVKEFFEKYGGVSYD